MQHFMFIILLLGAGDFSQGAITAILSKPSPLTVMENIYTAVTCNASSDSSNLHQVQWYYNETGIPVSNKSFENADYQVYNYVNNATLLMISGRVEDNSFEKTFICNASALDGSNDIAVLEVTIQVNLTVNSTQPEPVCLNGVAEMSCTFRSNPQPVNVSWQADVDQNNTLTDVESIGNGVVETSLLVLGAVSSGTYFCNASNTDFYNNTKAVAGTIELVVKNNRLDYVTLGNNGTANYCVIEWNNSFVPSFATGYQIRVTYDITEDKIIYLRDSNKTEYTWIMDDDFEDIAVAIEMGNCLGPFQTSDGNCTYTPPTAIPPTQDNTALIVVSSVLGSFTLILLILVAYLYTKKMRNTKNTKDVSIPAKKQRRNDYTENPRNPEIQMDPTSGHWQSKSPRNRRRQRKDTRTPKQSVDEGSDNIYETTLSPNDDRGGYDNPNMQDEVYNDTIVVVDSTSSRYQNRAGNSVEEGRNYEQPMSSSQQRNFGRPSVPDPPEELYEILGNQDPDHPPAPMPKDY